MTVPLHHVRFVNYTPASVTAVAFPPLAPATPYPTASSSSAASSSSRPAKGACGLMAVGKGNGQVELFKWVDQAEGGQGWVFYRRLVSPAGTKVDTLVFTLRQAYLRQPARRRAPIPTVDDIRLFSSGSSSDLVEWDLQRGCILKLYPTQSGTLWSLAPNPSQTLLALGCADGSIRLLSLSDDGDLVHFRRFERTKARLLSIAWGPPTKPAKKAVKLPAVPSNGDGDSDASSSGEDEDEVEQWADSWLVTGCSDSCLRKWDFKTGRVVERMAVEREKTRSGGKSRGGNRSLVWCVGVLRDGTIVSGDSLGQVRFWDAQTNTQIVAFSAHAADVLCLAVGPDNKSVFTSGIDQKTLQFTAVPAPVTAGSTSRRALPAKWIQSSARRFHTHDVLALAVYPPASTLPAGAAGTTIVAPVLVSGGVDTTLVMTPCGSSSSASGAGSEAVVNPIPKNAGSSGSTLLGDAFFRKQGSLNGVDASTISLSASGRLMLARLESSLALFELAPINRSDTGRLLDDDDGTGTGGGWQKLLDMELSATTSLVASAISDDGKWLAVSDLGETRVFYLDEDDEEGTITPRRLKTLTATLHAQCPKAMNLERNGTGASALAFTPDSHRLVLAAALTGDITVVDLSAVVSDESSRLGEASVVRVFEQGTSATVGGRVVAGGKRVKSTAAAAAGDMDVDGNDSHDTSGALSSSSSSSSSSQGGRATVKCLAVGPDGQWLAVSDLLGRTRVYNLDTLQLHAHLPTFSAQPPAALLFVPSPVSPTQSLLLLALPNGNQLHAYDVENRRFPPALSVAMPDSVRGLHDPVIGLAADTRKAAGSSARSVLLWGATWILRVRLAVPGTGKGKSNKKKRALAIAAAAAAPDNKMAVSDSAAVVVEEVDMDAPAKEDTGRFKLTTTFRPLIGLGFVGEDELVVVERPWLDLVKDLPASYFKAGKYGT